AGVWITRSACPAAVARRTSSSALYAAMPPLTPSRIRAMVTFRRPVERGQPAVRRLRAPAGWRSGVVVFELAGRHLLGGLREVVFRSRFDHRGRKLVERTLAEVVVVAVDLAGALGGHEHARVVGVDVLEQTIDSWGDHVGGLSSLSAV